MTAPGLCRGGDPPALHVLETLADRHRILPLSATRITNDASVFLLTRRLAQRPQCDHPWLPVGTLGPLLIMGHYNPAAMDFLGVPDPFRVEVVIDRRLYDMRHSAVWAKWLSRLSSPGVSLVPPRRQEPNGGSMLRETLDWFLQHYPLQRDERRLLQAKLAPQRAQESLSYREVDRVVPQLGIALHRIRTGSLVFNPSYAPAPSQLTPRDVNALIQLRAYPLFEGLSSRYWLCDEGTDLKAVEREWNCGNPSVERSLPVLGERHAIQSRLKGLI